MWLFGQVWLLCLLAFVIGAVLNSLLFTRPLRKRLRALEEQQAEGGRFRADALAETPSPVVSAPVDEPRPERVPSWEREERVPSWERAEDYPEPVATAWHQPEPEPEPVREPEPEPEPTTQLMEPATQLIHAEEQPQDSAPLPIPNPSPAEMGLLASRLAGEPSSAETTSVMPPAIERDEYSPSAHALRDDLEAADMELADHVSGTPSQSGQLAYAPADDWEDDQYLVDDVVEDDLSEDDRVAAAERTGPVSADVVREAEEAVAARAAERNSMTGELPVIVDEPEAEPEPEPTPEPEPEPQPQPEPEPEPQPELDQQGLLPQVTPVPVRPEHFGRPIPPGAAAEAVQPQPEPITPEPAAASAAPAPVPAPAPARERPRSLFEPVLDPDDDDDGSYDGPHGFPPLQTPTPPRPQQVSEPFTPTLAPGLLDGTAPKPLETSAAGLPKRTVGTEAWPRMDKGAPALGQDAPQPFAPKPAPFRPRAQFNTIPRNTDQAPIRRPSSGGPRTPFGPGSALPKPDGSAPSAEYSVKASVASRSYRTADSQGFAEATAEVWFRTAEEAERAGFRAV